MQCSQSSLQWTAVTGINQHSKLTVENIKEDFLAEETVGAGMQYAMAAGGGLQGVGR